MGGIGRISGSCLLLLLISIGGFGCAAGRSAGQPGTDPAPESAGGLVDLDSLDPDSDRLATANYVLAGDRVAVSAGVTLSGGTLTIQAPPAGMAWAIWGWRRLDYYNLHPHWATVELADPNGKFWIGVPDFYNMQWKFAGPFTGSDMTLDLSDVSMMRTNFNGVSYIAVICYDGGRARVHSVEIETGTFNTQLVLPLRWTSASYRDDENGKCIRLTWNTDHHYSTWEVRRWEAGQDPATATVFTEYTPGDEGWPNGTIDSHYYYDFAVEPGRYYQYRVVQLDWHGNRSEPGPVALGCAAPASDSLTLSGRVVFDDYFLAPGVELYLPEVELYTTTDELGCYRFPGLTPGAYNVWITAPLGPLHGALVALQEGNTAVADMTIDPGSVPRHNWYWLYPPKQVHASRAGGNTVQLSWTTAKYATGYRVLRSCALEPLDLYEVYNGPDLSVTLNEEPAGELLYYVRSRESTGNWYFDDSPLSLPATLTIPAAGIPADSVYAIPAKSTATPGERVRVTVYCNKSASPLQFMNGCRITYESANIIHPSSFNVGAPGGGQYHLDGVWQAGGFTGDAMASVPLLYEGDNGAGRKWMDFNVTGLGGTDFLNGTGAMFNFEIEVHSDVHFCFIGEYRDLWRTYYSDSSSDEHNWRDYYNYGHPGITLVED